MIPDPRQTRIGVEFEKHGATTLILEHAHLERITEDDMLDADAPEDFE